MICHLCNQFFVEEDSFFGIFQFDDICDQCKISFNPQIMYESIPIALGIVDYYYMFENTNLSVKQENFLSKHLDKIYNLILEKYNKYDIFIYLDDQVYYQEENTKKLLMDYKKAFVFSLSRKEIIYKDLF